MPQLVGSRVDWEVKTQLELHQADQINFREPWPPRRGRAVGEGFNMAEAIFIKSFLAATLVHTSP